MDFLTFVSFYLICSIVLFSIIGFIIYLIIRKKVIKRSEDAEKQLEEFFNNWAEKM